MSSIFIMSYQSKSTKYLFFFTLLLLAFFVFKQNYGKNLIHSTVKQLPWMKKDVVDVL